MLKLLLDEFRRIRITDKNQIFAQNADFELKIDYFWVQMPQNENFWPKNGESQLKCQISVKIEENLKFDSNFVSNFYEPKMHKNHSKITWNDQKRLKMYFYELETLDSEGN